MTRKIAKTTVTFTVLHQEDEPLPSDLSDILYECNEGNAVGWETSRDTVPVPPEKVAEELVALGNDGEFFADED